MCVIGNDMWGMCYTNLILETIMKWHGWFFTHACETFLCNYYLFSSPLTIYFSVQVPHSFLATTLISFFYSISMP